jgi:hypothetical protein
VHYLAVHKDLASEELIGREVDLGAIRQPVPVVVADLGPIDVDLAEDQITPEQVLDH